MTPIHSGSVGTQEPTPSPTRTAVGSVGLVGWGLHRGNRLRMKRVNQSRTNAKTAKQENDNPKRSHERSKPGLKPHGLVAVSEGSVAEDQVSQGTGTPMRTTLSRDDRSLATVVPSVDQ